MYTRFLVIIKQKLNNFYMDPKNNQGQQSGGDGATPKQGNPPHGSQPVPQAKTQSSASGQAQGGQPQGGQPTPPPTTPPTPYPPQGYTPYPHDPGMYPPGGAYPPAGYPPYDPNMYAGGYPPYYPPQGGYPPQGAYPSAGYPQGQSSMQQGGYLPTSGMPGATYPPLPGTPQGAYPPPTGGYPPATPEDTTPANFQLGTKFGPKLNVKVPKHSLNFDEEYFIRLLAGSISLSKDEKKRIIESIPKLKQSQIDELIRIFEEEKQKFAALSKKHVPQLEKLATQHHKDWMDLETEFQQDNKKKEDTGKADEIRKKLGI